jgi:predicted amidophosphoribosyltransferase
LATIFDYLLVIMGTNLSIGAKEGVHFLDKEVKISTMVPVPQNKQQEISIRFKEAVAKAGRWAPAVVVRILQGVRVNGRHFLQTGRARLSS